MVEAFTDTDGLVMDDDAIDLDSDEVIQVAQPLPQPKVPTAAQIAAHNLTHLPYRSWCPHCVAARRPNTHHRSSSPGQSRADPLLVADYCFVRDNDDDEYPQKIAKRRSPKCALLCIPFIDESLDCLNP